METKQKTVGETTEQTEVPSVITTKHEEAIAKYLSSRLGTFGIRWYEFNWRPSPKGYSYKHVGTINLAKKDLGIFGFALSECELDVQIWYSREEQDVQTVHVTTHLSYRHIGGGSNGCDLGINLLLRLRDCEIIEEVRN